GSANLAGDGSPGHWYMWRSPVQAPLVAVATRIATDLSKRNIRATAATITVGLGRSDGTARSPAVDRAASAPWAHRRRRRAARDSRRSAKCFNTRSDAEVVTMISGCDGAAPRQVSTHMRGARRSIRYRPHRQPSSDRVQFRPGLGMDLLRRRLPVSVLKAIRREPAAPVWRAERFCYHFWVGS